MSVLLETTAGDIVIDLAYNEFQLEAYNFLKLCKCNYYKYQKIVKNGDEINFGDPIIGFKERNDQLVYETSINGLLDVSEETTLVPKLIKTTSKNSDNSTGETGLEKGSIAFKVIKQDGIDLIGSKVVLKLVSCLYPAKELAYFGNVPRQYWEVLDKFMQLDDKMEIRVKNILIIRDPFPDPEGFQQFDVPLPIGDVELPSELIEKHQAKSKMSLLKSEIENQELALEIIGDIPSSTIKPLKTVLFVCKLNAMTNAKDLAQIFSRFGQIISVEIVRDKDTGRSLGYGFIEFDSEGAVELAYSNMEGVIIDDKKIHVDFSQSVSKLASQWTCGKNK
ncbi:hypothetical protein TPHA_0B04300 [Tetrapisispora phaffii CBS 4417]|uniref:Peptidyl-prolyl cis-trans isomerase n=1 Tax=Tetrapisispora phaffii (strain ATCC 24235 / CBS 4417 / NBRC 1672 / NRRL Y-8282 / UCD 70-5) TaxID=1071381 RepID=G8BQ18_TETPH|nr:hypothetical protein TPHA_0B04300 [Tetrapisispora phaffii CBS 4417]CCE62099.1 hypothetical protein TPHA_0B04300 [Tetrapisispora phaffii CBS 4417]